MGKHALARSTRLPVFSLRRCARYAWLSSVALVAWSVPVLTTTGTV